MTTESNLERFNRAIDHLDPARQRSATNYVIGYVARSVPAETWEAALNGMLRHVMALTVAPSGSPVDLPAPKAA